LFEIFNSVDETVGKISQVKSGLECQITAPPFKVESHFRELVQLTQGAGVKSVFEYSKDWELVDWGKLRDEAKIKVETIIQKASIDFTKKGTEAAAATNIVIGVTGCCSFTSYTPPPVKHIIADKPFLFVLARPQEPDKPLFVGVVNEVAGEPSDGASNPFRTFYNASNLTGFNDIGLSGVPYGSGNNNL